MSSTRAEATWCRPIADSSRGTASVRHDGSEGRRGAGKQGDRFGVQDAGVNRTEVEVCAQLGVDHAQRRADGNPVRVVVRNVNDDVRTDDQYAHPKRVKTIRPEADGGGAESRERH